MARSVTILEEGDIVWTIFNGELTPWRVRRDGNLERLIGQLRHDAVEALPEAHRG